MELSERFGATAEGRIEIELPLSQEELAAWTGASREAVSKALQLLRSLRIVETGRRHVTVLDIEALRRAPHSSRRVADCTDRGGEVRGGARRRT